MSQDQEAGRPVDHFSAVADGYVVFRPRYPESLFDYLAAMVPRRQQAWDVGCGSGQATLPLAERFAFVRGTDISAAQIEAAPRRANVTFRVASAEASGLPDKSVDLITTAQSLHWFPLDLFYAEVDRVLVPDGIFATWTYGVMDVEGDEINELVQRFRTVTVGEFWPPERRHVDNRYMDIPFPFEEIPTPPYTLSMLWNLNQLMGYLRSWSATARYLGMFGEDPVLALAEQLKPLWGDPLTPHQVSWPLTLRIGRKRA